ncbi:MAG: hypothetical protein A3H93_18725 [Rhodocyclales bacterium RIFCSPLOWO2_02_FULL_63_24]|nr:MAG: hypothetical protein A3H93_18725 [Rhodocyclales bacterium RIFCSPLOWO2_02_FULL_63_24]
MNSKRWDVFRSSAVLRNAVFAAFAWMVISAGSVFWYLLDSDRQILEIARHEAAAYIGKDIAFRAWATSHGGVYVAPSETTPPNPYLSEIPDRDVETTSGKKLTLMNPAYVLREVQTHFSGPFGEKGRIVSLRPLNPINAPDEWERVALLRFEAGAREVSAVDRIDGVPHLRMMKPFLVEQGCLKCHGQQGYKVGDVRGGIAVSLSLEPFRQASGEAKRHLMIGHAVGWIVGLLAIGLVAVRSRRRELERERANDILRNSEASLAEAQRIAHLGNWELDLLSNVLTWSPEIFRIFELDPTKFGASYEAFLGAIHPDDRAMVNQAYTDSVANRTPYDIVHRLLMRDGRIKYVNEKCETRYAPDGKPIRSLGTIHDITERQRAEKAVRALNQELEQRVAARTAQLEAANTELEAFAFSVSHDLRAPLRAIDGFSRILVEDYESTLDAEGRRLLGVVRENSARMAQLIDDILSFSRMSRRDMETGDLDIGALAQSVFDELRAAVPGRMLVLKIGELPTAWGDRAMMRQVLANLISNAIKFTGPRAEALIEIAGDTDNGADESHFYVRDNGVGFDMQYVEKLFGVFQRLHSTEEFEGTGIGLAIVKRIIVRHGGRVWAEGEVDGGATMHFTLPRIAQPQQRRPQS